MILISLFSYFFFTLFSSSPFLPFFLLKKLKIFCGQFFEDENVFFFQTLLLSDFFSCVFLLASSFFLVCRMFSVFSRFFIISFLDFLLPILIWASSKNRFDFERNQKIIDSCLNIILFEKKHFFFDFSLFAIKPSPIHDLQKTFSICLCFQTLFGNYLLYPVVSVEKKNASKKELILFTFSLYFFLLFRSLFVCLLVMFALLVVTLLIEKMFAKKNLEKWLLQFSTFLLSCCDVLKNKLFLYNKLGRTSYHSPSQIFSRKDLPFFSSFSILFHSIQAFFANKETSCLFYLVFIFRKNLPFFFF